MTTRAPEPPDDNANKPSAENGFWRQLIDYTLANPLKVFGLAVLSFGGVLLLTFFTDIGHLPALDLQGIASMLYAVSLIGLVLVLCLATLLVAPGLMARSLLDEWPPAVVPSPAASLNGDDAGKAPRSRDELALTALPWLGAFVASASLLAWLLLRTISTAWTAAGIAAAGAGYLSLMIWLARRPGCPPMRWHWMLRDIVIACMSFALALTAILQFLTIGDLARSELGVIAALLLSLLAICAFVAWVICAAPRPLPLAAVVVVALVLMAVMLTLTRSVTATPHLIVRKLRLGDIEFASVAVTAAGCRQVNAAMGTVVCEPPQDPAGLATLCPVAIRSRMGAERLLEFGVPQWKERTTQDGRRLVASWQTPEQPLQRVVLSADAMPSWRPLQPELDPASIVAAPAPSGVEVQVWRESQAQHGTDTPLRRLCAVRLAPTAASAPSR